MSDLTSTVERDPVTGHLRLTGALDFAVVPTLRAELALLMDRPGPHTIDLSALTAMTGAGVTFVEELFEGGDVRLCCAPGTPAHDVLSGAGLTARFELIELD